MLSIAMMSLCALAGTQVSAVTPPAADHGRAGEISAVTFAGGHGAEHVEWRAQGSRRSIAGFVAGNDNYESLAAALEAAGLVETLSGEGPFTVFAPADSAFGKLDQRALRNTLRDRDRLTQILTYHVVPGRITAAELATRRALTTVNGQRLVVNLGDGIGLNEGVRVLTADVEASNGIIHAIDTVLVPAKQTIAETAKEAGFGTLLAALGAADLASTFASTDNAFTVLAPTDEAFAKLGNETIAALLEPANRDLLTKVLTFHVIEGRVYSDAFAAGLAPETLAGAAFEVTRRGEAIFADRSRIVATDINASNGVIHAIDAVLMPDGVGEELASRMAGPVSTSSAVGDALAIAVEVGAPLFNDGNFAACRAVYETTARNLLAFDAYGLSSREREALDSALGRLDPHDDRASAWTLRRAFDLIFRERSAGASDEH